MQKLVDRIFYSATDLTRFADCQYLTWLDRLNLDSPMEKATDDEQSKLVQAMGYAHEKDFLERLKRDGRHVAIISAEGSLEKRVAETKAAIASGANVIYQATLVRENLIGHADFLIRVDSVEGANGHQYEVVDTKLARSTKAKFILQLCFYSDLLADVTGQLPRHVHVELGNGQRESFRLNDYFYYYRHLLNRFLAFVQTRESTSVPYPVPCDFCSMCCWRDRCADKRLTDDHLSAVANITQQQIVKLEAAGIATVAQLAALAPDTSIQKLSESTIAKLREQAALQVEERETGKQRVVLLPAVDDEVLGFARLPEPNAGDVFFDLEGDPMVVGGLEYLFGIYYFDDGLAKFKCFWAHNRDEERKAFMDFMGFIADRIERYPAMHIYHYAHYENTALKRLMSMHGVCETTVDQLLREARLVDLYKVVREGLRISKDSYSIKALEAFYTEKRSGDVKNAGDSIVVYQRWRETQDPTLLESIRSYNEDDCRSTWQLREWLLSLRPSHLSWFSTAVVDEIANKKSVRQKSDKTIDHEEMLAVFHQRLRTAPENPDLEPALAELIFQLLDFHRRADKPVWWALFDRQDADIEDLLNDAEVIADLHAPEKIEGAEGCDVRRYHYPEQDFKAKAGDSAKRLDTLKDVEILAINEDEQTVDLEFKSISDEEFPARLSISIGAPFDSRSIRRALFVFAESALAGTGEYKAVFDYLLRRIPAIVGRKSGEAIIDRNNEALPQIIRAVQQLDHSYLFIQGPPGSGKTFTGSHVIAKLLQSGKRVAISSNSHKAVNNLLTAVDARMLEAKCSYFGMKKSSKKEQFIDSPFIENVIDASNIVKHKPQLVAGTVYLLCNKNLRDSFDYLFVDEAGQVSLANLVAMGMCAKNIILLGDQMQLGQPIQGEHPGRSGESALDYLLNGEATIAPERGVFLEKTYRMHPDVCRFISEAIYDSRLQSDPSTFSQALVLNDDAHPMLKPTGIRYVPVQHQGCGQRSEVEADLIKQLVANLLTQQYRNKKGEVKPITLNDILIVAPYNMQVNLLKRSLPDGARVGTVDKFQGQEAEVVIVSMTTSSQADMPRGLEFLFSKNRLNVALSRARSGSIFICARELFSAMPKSVAGVMLMNIFAMLNLEGK